MTGTSGVAAEINLVPTRVGLLTVFVASVVLATTAGAGTKAAPFRGTLQGTATPLGQVTLSRNGKSVSSLKSGRYKIVVDDTTPHSGLIMERAGGTTVVVTSTSFVGKRALTLTLKPGRWNYHGAVGSLHHFTVLG